MTKSPIISTSDAWLLDSALPALRHRGKVYEPPQDLLVTSELLAVDVHALIAATVHEAQLVREQLARREHQSPREPDAPPAPNFRERTMLMPAVKRSPVSEETMITRAVKTSTVSEETRIMPAIRLPHPLESARPTRRRDDPLHFCYLCGAAVLPWREACFEHDPPSAGLRRATTLVRIDDDKQPPFTLPIPSIQPRRRAS